MPDGFMEPFRRALGMAAERRLGQAAGDERWVGYFCTYSPVEIIHAAGFTPVRIVGAGDKVDLADALTPSFICPYLRKALNEGLAGGIRFSLGRCPGLHLRRGLRPDQYLAGEHRRGHVSHGPAAL